MAATLESRQALTLRAWEAVSTERHLQSVLEAVSDLVLPFVHFDSLAMIPFECGTYNFMTIHVPGAPLLEGETLEQFAKRHEHDKREVPSRPVRPYDRERTVLIAEAKRPYVCPDLLAAETWFEHEFELASWGIRCYTSVPLFVQQQLLGFAVFSRGSLPSFTEDELTILTDVSRAFAVAVANVIAHDEIRRVRSELEAENIALRAALGNRKWFDEIVGDSPALRRALNHIEQVAATDATVLITGETGTGKELIARAIHRCSARAGGPLIKVNCAALPPSLIASELFGHERGAFTGAIERRKGRFEQANGGTLFLDEIGELPLDLQPLLLRAIQEHEFERVGGSSTLRVDVRIVAATNKELVEEVRAGRFRSDLYYRLNVFPAHMPPLRERTEDVPALVAHFAQVYGERFKRSITQIDDTSVRLLQNYSWPGNIRELENIVERCVILSRGGVLRILPDMLATAQDGAMPDGECESIERALAECGGRISGANGAAKKLGLPASTLEFRIKRLGIDKFRFRYTRNSGVSWQS
ncbi:MAG: sigma 54-interacting transcriptional regulator [Acidobacteriaceae bacterium]|nr:sigma 54-interacting transcriptional regulator [Acidobacteriaceae bacterium]